MNIRAKIRFYINLFVLLLFLGTFSIVRSIGINKVVSKFNDNLPLGNGTKATVIILAGQSNASGCSQVEYLKENVEKEKFSEYQNGYDNVYINYFSSNLNISNGFVKCTIGQGENKDCFGPEVGLAEKLHKERPNEIFFIIKWAWGDTNLYKQWLSPSSAGKTGTHYKQFIKYVNNSLTYLEYKDYDISIEGLCFMQGESDSFSEENATNYKNNLSNFIKDVRREFKPFAAKDGIAFIDAYIAANPIYWVYYEGVNNSKKAVSEESKMNIIIDTNSHGLTCNLEPIENPDIPHYDSTSEIKLGHLFAEEIIKFL